MHIPCHIITCHMILRLRDFAYKTTNIICNVQQYVNTLPRMPERGARAKTPQEAPRRPPEGHQKDPRRSQNAPGGPEEALKASLFEPEPQTMNDIMRKNYC